MADLLNTSGVPLAPYASTTETVLPDWYTNYAMGVLSNQQAVSGTPYTTYTGPRIADFTPDQQAGFEATRAAAGSFAPALDMAGGALSTVAGMPSASTAAQPYLTASGALAPEVVGGYLDPYMTNVTDRIAALGNRNLTENLLPAIGDQFVGAGGYGGSRQAEAIGRAVRETQEGITSQQLGALSQGYQSSLGAAQTDLSRLGSLASTAGNLRASDVSSGISTAGALSDLGARTQGLGLAGAGALRDVGQAQQALDQQNLDVAHQDFLRQQGWDQTQIDALSRTLAAVKPAVPSTTLRQGYGNASSQPSSSTSTAGAIASALGAILLK